MDLTTCDERGVAWNFDSAERRQAARERVRLEKPMLLIGTPMCTRFCCFQYINDMKRSPEEVRRGYLKAMIHLKFMCELYREQVAGRRYFLHEHPEGATSWAESCVVEVGKLAGVQLVVGDQCQFGQAYGAEPVKKPTAWLSNSPKVLEALGHRCEGRGGACSRPGGGHHRSCSGPVAEAARIYPRQLCAAILRGFRSQLVADGRLLVGVMGMQVPDERPQERTIEQACAEAMEPMIELNAAGKGEEAFQDAITGQPLRADMVHAARREEL